ncbi:MAG: PH domain-containing protein [Candidatus Saccharimonas sp.]
MAHMKEKWQHREEIMDENAQLGELQASEAQPFVQKPVAYDAEGKPLYAAPTNQVPVMGPTQVVHVARSTEPVPVEVSEETKKRHEESKKIYPWLNLSDHEYIISAVRRHPIGMAAPLLATAFSLSLMFILIMNYGYFAELLSLPTASFGLVMLVSILLSILFMIGGYLAVWVYTNNRFFLTNESVIQEIQVSIFSKKEQTVSLMNIEDASFSQRGPLQTILNYGSIRLSTEGEETTYRFDYAANPREQIAILNNAVEAFKNGRPVEG